MKYSSPLLSITPAIVAFKITFHKVLPIAFALILPGLSLYSNDGVFSVNDISYFRKWAIASVFLYLLWYLIWFIISATSQAKYWRYAIVLIVALLTFSLAIWNYLNEFKGYYLFRIILAGILFMAIQFALRAQQNIADLRLEKEQLQTENYRVQFKALRAKIDPHFLFNSLNTLRSMVRQQHDNSEKFIISLADFYRQTLKHNENTSLPLLEELVVLESYLFLMKNRNEEAVSISMEIDEALHSLHLPSLALQIVLENCFKHNSMTSAKPLIISIYNSDDSHIIVSNPIQPKIEVVASDGYGLDLLRKRYELMDIRDGVLVEKTQTHFSVKLKLI